MIQDDFTINYGTKRVSHTAGTTVYTANALYSWLQDTFDELGQMDDPVPMSAQTPTAYSWINGWAFNSDTDYNYINGGAINDTTNNDLWANIYTLGTIEAGTQTYVEQDGNVLTSWWGTGHIDVLIKVQDNGTLIDSGNITVLARELGNAYDYFPIDLSAGGRNAVPLATANDLNNQTASGTIATYNDVTITFGSISRDLNNGNGAKNYDVEIDCAGRPLSEVYEYLKYVTRRGESGLLDGIEGQLYKYADSGYTPVKQAPFGTFAGGTYFGAQGVWITNYSANQSFQLISSDGSTQSPPNTVYVEVTGLVSGDRVAMFVLDGVGGDIDKAQYTIASATSNSITLNEAIGSDTPTSGYFRESDDSTVYEYTGWTGSTFSGVTPDPSAVNGDCFVPLLDAEATSSNLNNSLIYSSDIPVIVRVRRYGILPFEIEGLVTSSGLSQAAIRTIDNIVS